MPDTDEQQIRELVANWMRASRAGHTLTVLKRERGRWRIARDANLLAPVARPA